MYALSVAKGQPLNQQTFRNYVHFRQSFHNAIGLGALFSEDILRKFISKRISKLERAQVSNFNFNSDVFVNKSKYVSRT